MSRVCETCTTYLPPDAHHLTRFCAECARKRTIAKVKASQKRKSERTKAERKPRLCKECAKPLPPESSAKRQFCIGCVETRRLSRIQETQPTTKVAQRRRREEPEPADLPPSELEIARHEHWERKRAIEDGETIEQRKARLARQAEKLAKLRKLTKVRVWA